MPDWSASDAGRRTKQARGSKNKGRAFADAANSAAKRGLSEGSQVRIGNYAAKRAGRRAGRKGRRA